MAARKKAGIRKLLREHKRTAGRHVLFSTVEDELIAAASIRLDSSVSAFVRTAAVKAAERVAEAALSRRDRLEALLEELRALEAVEAELADRS